MNFDSMLRQVRLALKPRSGAFKQECVRLNAGNVRRFDNLPPRTMIECRGGRIWLTVTGLERDIVLRAGNDFQPASGGAIVIEALAESCLRFHSNNN